MGTRPGLPDSLDDADKLWRAANALRGQVDAAQYKDVVLGLLFLKYISDSFEARRDELRGKLEAEGIGGEQLDRLLESRDEYTAERVFWVPPEARWANLQNQATRPDIETLIDDAILAVERDNPNLKGKLPRDYARRVIASEEMKGLIDLIAGIGFRGERAGTRYARSRVGFLPSYLMFPGGYTCSIKSSFQSPSTVRIALASYTNASIKLWDR